MFTAFVTSLLLLLFNLYRDVNRLVRSHILQSDILPSKSSIVASRKMTNLKLRKKPFLRYLITRSTILTHKPLQKQLNWREEISGPTLTSHSRQSWKLIPISKQETIQGFVSDRGSWSLINPIKLMRRCSRDRVVGQATIPLVTIFSTTAGTNWIKV